MKKILSIVAAMVLALSMAAVSVYAQEADEASVAQINCSHSYGTVTDTVVRQVFEPVNDSKHGYSAIDYTRCSICNTLLDISDRYYVNVTDHNFGPETYCGSNHSGNYTEHYYTYRKACQACNRAVERRGLTGCTAKRCIEPQ